MNTIRIKKEKEAAAEKKHRNEMLFLGRIQHCYHKERKQKL
jgi:hypothetical protein